MSNANPNCVNPLSPHADEDFLCKGNDSIYNAVNEALRSLCQEELEWDMALIGPATDHLVKLLEDHGHKTCHPFEDEDGNICYSTKDLCEGCPKAKALESVEYIQIPVYTESKECACASEMLDAYRASMAANMACQNAIETVIAANYNHNRLNTTCIKPVLELFGIERVLYVLANTVQYKNHDARFSAENRAWAATVKVCPECNQWFVVESHSGLTNLFLSAVRREVGSAGKRGE